MYVYFNCHSSLLLPAHNLTFRGSFDPQETGGLPMVNLARCSNKLVIDQAARVEFILDTLTEEGVLAHLSELHGIVTKTPNTS